MELAVHYLVAVLRESAMPVSDDIGGQPQVIVDDNELSEPASPAESVSFEIEDSSDASGLENDSGRVQSPVQEALPSYRDATKISPSPPSYDSLLAPAAEPGRATTPRAVRHLVHKMRTRRHRKKGYCAQEF